MHMNVLIKLWYVAMSAIREKKKKKTGTICLYIIENLFFQQSLFIVISAQSDLIS